MPDLLHIFSFIQKDNNFIHMSSHASTDVLNYKLHTCICTLIPFQNFANREGFVSNLGQIKFIQ